MKKVIAAALVAMASLGSAEGMSTERLMKVAHGQGVLCVASDVERAWDIMNGVFDARKGYIKEVSKTAQSYANVLSFLVGCRKDLFKCLYGLNCCDYAKNVGRLVANVYSSSRYLAEAESKASLIEPSRMGAAINEIDDLLKKVKRQELIENNITTKYGAEAVMILTMYDLLHDMDVLKTYIKNELGINVNAIKLAWGRIF